jgi:hypothetical protein
LALASLLFTSVPLAPAVAPARADGNAIPPTEVVDPESNAGVAAAIGCGLGIRFFPLLIGGGVGFVATWVGVCAFMFLDAFATPDGGP